MRSESALLSRHEPQWLWIDRNLVLHDHWTISRPSLELNEANAFLIRDRSELAGEKSAEARVMGRNDDLSPPLNPAQEIDKAEKVHIVETLEWVVEGNYAQRKRFDAQVECEEDTDRENVQLRARQNSRRLCDAHVRGEIVDRCPQPTSTSHGPSEKSNCPKCGMRVNRCVNPLEKGLNSD
jgi:hypothetical protein